MNSNSTNKIFTKEERINIINRLINLTEKEQALQNWNYSVEVLQSYSKLRQTAQYLAKADPFDFFNNGFLPDFDYFEKITKIGEGINKIRQLPENEQKIFFVYHKKTNLKTVYSYLEEFSSQSLTEISDYITHLPLTYKQKKEVGITNGKFLDLMIDHGFQCLFAASLLFVEINDDYKLHIFQNTELEQVQELVQKEKSEQTVFKQNKDQEFLLNQTKDCKEAKKKELEEENKKKI